MSKAEEYLKERGINPKGNIQEYEFSTLANLMEEYLNVELKNILENFSSKLMSDMGLDFDNEEDYIDKYINNLKNK